MYIVMVCHEFFTKLHSPWMIVCDTKRGSLSWTLMRYNMCFPSGILNFHVASWTSIWHLHLLLYLPCGIWDFRMIFRTSNLLASRCSVGYLQLLCDILNFQMTFHVVSWICINVFILKPTYKCCTIIVCGILNFKLSHKRGFCRRWWWWGRPAPRSAAGTLRLTRSTTSRQTKGRSGTSSTRRWVDSTARRSGWRTERS